MICLLENNNDVPVISIKTAVNPFKEIVTCGMWPIKETSTYMWLRQ